MAGTRYEVEDAEELDEHGSRVVQEVNGIEVVVFNVEGEYHAVPNRCPHVGAPLGKGTLTGHTETTDEQELVYDEAEKIVECPWHCWRFDVTSGSNIDDPQYRIPTFDVKVEDDGVFVVL